MNLEKYTQKSQEALLEAQRLAENFKQQAIEPAHILLALLKQQDGVLSLAEPSPAFLTLLQPWADHLDYAGPPGVIHLALASWAQIHGLVSLELFGHLAPAPEYGDVDALFEAEIQASVKRMGMG
jgi:hypothetical protein